MPPTTRHPHLATLAVITGLTLATTLPGTAAADDVRDGQWYLDALGIHEAHELSQGAGVTIGVIDRGVDPEHPDLEGSVLPGIDFGTSEGDGLEPRKDHGTATASVIVGHGHGSGGADGILGIAPKAKVISVGIDWDNPTRYDNQWIPQAIEWLVDNGADIISISMGSGPGNSGPFKYATDNGIPIVASAGNTTDDESLYPGEIKTDTAWPAREKYVIPVTGVDRNNGFWNESRDLKMASIQPQLGLSAPAVDIPTATPGGGYDTKRGTSFSAPIVAGTLALIKSAYPDLSYNQWIDRLLDTVDDKGPEGFDNEYGWGIVNPLAALTEETVYEGASGDQVSSPDDRLPLEEQGQESDDSDTPGDENTDDEPDDSAVDTGDQALTGSNDTGIPVWVWIAIPATAILTATLIAALLIRHRNQTNTTPATAATTTFNPPAPPAGTPPTNQLHHPAPPPPEHH